MMISIIVAIGKSNQIGKDNRLLWKIRDDLNIFKNLTYGHHVVMGRKTFESLPSGLPGRKILVLSKDKIQSLNDALQIAEKSNENEVFVCGGASVYKEALKIADRLYISSVDYDGEADTYFPEIDFDEWQQIEEKKFEKNDINQYSFVFKILCRKKKTT